VVYYVGVENVDVAKDRIAHRVSVGGHGIPDSDVERRYVESFQRLTEIIPECNKVFLYDNTQQFRRFAVYEDGKCVFKEKELPNWYQAWIEGSCELDSSSIRH